jgi:hypothetical protein
MVSDDGTEVDLVNLESVRERLQIVQTSLTSLMDDRNIFSFDEKMRKCRKNMDLPAWDPREMKRFCKNFMEIVDKQMITAKEKENTKKKTKKKK